MDDIFSKWKIMWDAKEWGTQGFFMAMAIVAVLIMANPFRATTEGTMVKKGITFAIGLTYLVLVLIGYFQLVPKASSY